MAEPQTDADQLRSDNEKQWHIIDNLLDEWRLPNLLKQLFHQLFDDFLLEKGPQEGSDADDVPDTPERLATITRGLSDALPGYQTYERRNGGQPVIFSSPVEGAAQVTSGFGQRERPKAGASTNHKGVDIGARGGDRSPNVLAAADGYVLFSGKKSGFGNLVIIGHADGTQTYYGHLTGENMPQANTEVTRGQRIGVMGNEGISTGTHLHFEVRLNGQPIAPRVNGVALTKGASLQGDSVAGGSPVRHAATAAHATANDFAPHIQLAAKNATQPQDKPAATADAHASKPFHGIDLSQIQAGHQGSGHLPAKQAAQLHTRVPVKV